MSLKAFHVLFVSVSVVLSLGFAGWAFAEFRRTADKEYIWWAIAGLAAACGLIIYGRWFLRKLKDTGYL